MTATGPLLGLVDWRLPTPGPPALELAAELGADGVQLDLGGPGRAPRLDAAGSLARVRAAAAATGTAVLALSANALNDTGLTAPSGTVAARRTSDVLARLLDAAQELAAPLVCVPSFRRSAIDGPADLDRTGEVLAAAASDAETRGLLLASENVLEGPRAAQLAARVGSPAFRLLLDTHNLAAAEVPLPGLFASAASFCADQIHLKDGRGDSVGTVPLGSGEGRVAATLDAAVRHAVPLRALVLENDYRDGGTDRAAADLDWARRHSPAVTPSSGG